MIPSHHLLRSICEDLLHIQVKIKKFSLSGFFDQSFKAKALFLENYAIVDLLLSCVRKYLVANMHHSKLWHMILKVFLTLSWDKTLESQDLSCERGQLTLQFCTCNRRISVREIQYFCCINWVEWLVKPKEGATGLKDLFPLNVFLSTRPWYHIDIN